MRYGWRALSASFIVRRARAAGVGSRSLNAIVRRRIVRYQDFIGELRQYIDEARRLLVAGVTHEDPGFRSWRHRSESLVREAAAHGYRLPGKYNSSERHYADFYDYSPKGMVHALAKDLKDSEIELIFLVEQFDKYGVPPLAPALAANSPALQLPDKMTLSWLFHNVPMTYWLATLGAVLAIFLFGVGAGRTTTYTAVEAWVKSVWSGQ
jgi:hypothetical protein